MKYRPTKDEKELLFAISSLEDEDETLWFLRDLLTEAEIKEFANRWKAAKMLSKHIAYKKIEKETGMSSTTIARIQRWLQGGMGGYPLMIERIK